MQPPIIEKKSFALIFQWRLASGRFFSNTFPVQTLPEQREVNQKNIETLSVIYRHFYIVFEDLFSGIHSYIFLQNAVATPYPEHEIQDFLDQKVLAGDIKSCGLMHMEDTRFGKTDLTLKNSYLFCWKVLIHFSYFPFPALLEGVNWTDWFYFASFYSFCREMGLKLHVFFCLLFLL